MVITTLYDINQTVLIKEIETPAVIVGIRMEGKNLIYKLEYWIAGEIKVADQDEWQIGPIK